MMYCKHWRICLFSVAMVSLTRAAETRATGNDDYHVQHNDGSYEFGYDTKSHFHHSDATRNNVVRGQFGSRNPSTGQIDTTSYTAGPRGYRPRGKNVARKYDLSQSGPRPIGSKDDPYFDPSEDPSYSFGFKTRTYNRQESSNRLGDVTGRYSFIDDVGEKHNVEYIAGKSTGFHVKTPYPDNPRATGPLFYQGPGKPPRGRTSIQRGLDGSYKFVAAGPDQRRTESSDSTGHVRGSYTFIDDKGTQHSVHYIAGPETGYRVLKNVKGPHFPNWFPFGAGRPPYPLPPIIDDYPDKNIEDIFENPTENLNTAATDHVKPQTGGGFIPNKGTSNKDDFPIDSDEDDFGFKPATTKRPPYRPFKPIKPSDLDDFDYTGPTAPSGSSEEDFTNFFMPSKKPSTSQKPPKRKPFYENPSTTASTFYTDELPKPFDSTASSNVDDDDDFGLFGRPSKKPSFVKPTSGRPTSGRPTSSSGAGKQPVYGTTDGSEPPVRLGATFDGKSTILTNIGDKHISFAPGVAVRAHVQSIDILPYGSRIPTPTEQLKAEASDVEQKKTEKE